MPARSSLGNTAGTVVGVGILQWQTQSSRSWKGATTLKCVWDKKSLHEDMAATLVTVMLVITHICEGGESAFA